MDPKYHHKVPYKREARRSEEEVGDVTSEARDWIKSQGIQVASRY